MSQLQIHFSWFQRTLICLKLMYNAGNNSPETAVKVEAFQLGPKRATCDVCSCSRLYHSRWKSYSSPAATVPCDQPTHTTIPISSEKHPPHWLPILSKPFLLQVPGVPHTFFFFAKAVTAGRPPLWFAMMVNLACRLDLGSFKTSWCPGPFHT